MAGRIVELLKVGSEGEKETARKVIVELHLEPDTIAGDPAERHRDRHGEVEKRQSSGLRSTRGPAANAWQTPCPAI